MINHVKQVKIIHLFRLGDDGACLPLAIGGGGEAETSHSSPQTVPRERLAEGRARRCAAAPAGLRTEGGSARGGEQTPRLHGFDPVSENLTGFDV